MTKPTSFAELPSYEALQDKKRFWVWGPPGSHEEGMGMLNLLTPDHVAKSASKEIRSGDRVGLGWEFHKVEQPYFDRIHYDMKIIQSGPTSFDDEYHFNPQQSSQWDGFRHHSQPDKESSDGQLWYGGTSKKEIAEGKSDRIGIHHWAQEGIAGRGVLIDYASWAVAKGNKVSTMAHFGITVAELNEVCEYFNVKIEPGDILFLRIGFIEEWNSLTEEQMIAYRNGPIAYHTGVEASEEMVKWLWDHHFSAVASDAVSFEVFPPKDPNFSLHHYLLAGWGVPIGEMFDLEGLAKVCQKLGRYSFFVTSVPFNAVGGVSSAPNAMAIF
ncbi:hypothetical protein TRVA0_067S00320 [Trichomonascus vanleenenianus]|uniref:uncharacterized protein n=1 Tax=Trichomonascus vanleenenianus TaxID=2268995 RepID=UPI003ECB7B0E